MGSCGKIFALLTVLLAAIGYQQYRALHTPAERPQLDAKAFWGPGPAAAYKENTKIVPFAVQFKETDQTIVQLVVDLNRSRPLAPPLEDVNFEYGVNSVALKEIVRYWRDDYLPRWPARREFLNQFAQFKTQIQGLDMHFLHVKPSAQQAAKKRVVPLLLIHGWPGSVREFYEIIPKLTAPNAQSDIVFEVVVPSLPGYGWSQASAKKDLGVAEMSIVLRNLMIRLGHTKFVIQGGDWGSALGASIATLFPHNVLGYHSNMCFTNSPLANLKALVASFSPSSFVAEEHVAFFFPRTDAFLYLIEESGYMHIQATKPDTIGTVLAHNPVGLLAYIVEKFSTWTKPHYRQLPQGGWEKFSARYKDGILDNIMIYYLSNSITTSQRLYAEAFTFKQRALKLEQVPTEVPAGCARFKHDLAHTMEWQLKEKFLNLVHSSYHNDGGHFIALEQPDVLYADFMQFVNKLAL